MSALVRPNLDSTPFQRGCQSSGLQGVLFVGDAVVTRLRFCGGKVAASKMRVRVLGACVFELCRVRTFNDKVLRLQHAAAIQQRPEQQRALRHRPHPQRVLLRHFVVVLCACVVSSD